MRRPSAPSCLLAALVFAACIPAAVVHGQSPPQPPQQSQPVRQPPGQPRVAAATPPAAAQPPALSPQEQAALDQLLAAWETRNNAVRTWSCTFKKSEYNAWSPPDEQYGGQAAFVISNGTLKYAAPDKGLYRIDSAWQWSPQHRKYVPLSGEPEHWVCNGESVFEFRRAERQLRETKLPPEMRGKAISDGPLPFVFGAKAETLKKRYWMRIVPLPSTAEFADKIMLEALPRYQGDAANFAKVELILHRRDLMPFAIQIHKPGGQDRDVYRFDPSTNLIDQALDLIRDFAKPVTPPGYTYILEDGRPKP